MTRVLHLITRPPEAWVQSLIESQTALPEVQVEVIDLTQATPDYTAVVHQIFESDSIATW
jgi:hypothetical protein